MLFHSIRFFFSDGNDFILFRKLDPIFFNFLLLGMAASHGHSVVIRQSLYRSHYALLGEDLLPNPDYWLSVLYKKLVGTGVLKLWKGQGEKASTLRLYAHCSETRSIVMFGANISDKPAVVLLDSPLNQSTIGHYILSPPEGDLQSRGILLNGNLLELKSDGTLPELKPRQTSKSDLLMMKPYEMAFWTFDSLSPAVCA